MEEDKRRGLVAARTRAPTHGLKLHFPVRRTTASAKVTWHGAFPPVRSEQPPGFIKAVYPRQFERFAQLFELSVCSPERPIFGFAYGSLRSAVAKNSAAFPPNDRMTGQPSLRDGLPSNQLIQDGAAESRGLQAYGTKGPKDRATN